MAYIPKPYIHQPEIQKFYDDFRVRDEKLPSIYRSKSQEVLEALKTTDTTELVSLFDQLQYIEYEKQDLPHLHKALLAKYLVLDEDNYATVTDYIIRCLAQLNDSSTIRFISEVYPGLKGKDEELRYDLLYLLGLFRTNESYSLLKNYIISDLPEKGKNQLQYALADSLKLTATLFPDILSQTKDSIFIDGIVPVMKTLVDSNYLNITDLLPYKNLILSHAAKRMELLKENEDLWYRYTDWIELIAQFNDRETNEALRSYLSIGGSDFRYNVVMALIKNDQPVPVSEMEKLAADIYYRAYLYSELKKLKKQQLFPSKYATQEKMAQSEIYSIASEESEAKVSLIGERVVEFMGKRQKFYLYKVSYEYEDGDSEHYLGIAGGYALNQKEIQNYPDAMGIFWTEAFEKNKIDSQFKTYLESMAADLKEEKKEQMGN